MLPPCRCLEAACSKLLIPSRWLLVPPDCLAASAATGNSPPCSTPNRPGVLPCLPLVLLVQMQISHCLLSLVPLQLNLLCWPAPAADPRPAALAAAERLAVLATLRQPAPRLLLRLQLRRAPPAAGAVARPPVGALRSVVLAGIRPLRQLLLALLRRQP